jgi:LysM repeat protein
MSRSPARRGAVLLAVPLTGALLATSAAPGWVPYRITWGDNLWNLAIEHGTTVAALKRANGLTGDTIFAGGVLSLPGAGAVTSASTGGCADRTVLIRPGDSASVIARRTGVSLGALARANGLGGGMKILAGRRLLVPGATTACGTATSRSGATTVTAAIRAAAAREGVDPALALAVASVESGFDQSAVSPAGAVGVMQLMPRTTAWLSRMIGRRLDPSSLRDNVTGGVVYLRYLLESVPRGTAVAGYYQGLGSVRDQGMFTDTRQYVSKVLTRRSSYV